MNTLFSICRFYWRVLGRAVYSTLRHSRREFVRFFVMLILLGTVVQVPARLAPVLHGVDRKTLTQIIDGLTANYAAELTVIAGPLVISGVAVFVWNLIKAPVMINVESTLELEHARRDLRFAQEQLDDVLKSPEHIAHLKQVLLLVPNGPQQSNTMYGALREHLPDSPIWAEQERLRKLVAEAAEGRQTAYNRLQSELIRHKLLDRTGANALLSRRVAAATSGEAMPFPDEPWHVEEGSLLKLGRDYGIAGVSSFDDACSTIEDIRKLWKAIPRWGEVRTVVRAEHDLPNARSTLGRHIAELTLHPQFPGRCRLCSPRTGEA